MLAGTERHRRVHDDRESTARYAAAVMRAKYKKPADPQRRKGCLVFRQPIARREFFFANINESASRGSSGKGGSHLEVGRQQSSAGISFHLPLFPCSLKGRYGRRKVIKK
jgi:hypothetical protein